MKVASSLKRQLASSLGLTFNFDIEYISEAGSLFHYEKKKKNLKFDFKQCSGQFLKFNDHIKEGRKKGKGSNASPTKLLAFDVVQYGNLVTS